MKIWINSKSYFKNRKRLFTNFIDFCEGRKASKVGHILWNAVVILKIVKFGFFEKNEMAFMFQVMF